MSNIVQFPGRTEKVIVCAVQEGEDALIRFAGTREEVSLLIQVIIQEAMKYGKKIKS